MLLKAKGESILPPQGAEGGSLAVDRLIELRVVLEKMRPLEMKLKYQIDKLVKAASSTSLAGLTMHIIFMIPIVLCKEFAFLSYLYMICLTPLFNFQYLSMIL